MEPERRQYPVRSLDSAQKSELGCVRVDGAVLANDVLAVGTKSLSYIYGTSAEQTFKDGIAPPRHFPRVIRAHRRTEAPSANLTHQIPPFLCEFL